MQDLANDLARRLRTFNIKSRFQPRGQIKRSPDDILMIKMIITAAFYPNYIVGEYDDKEAVEKAQQNREHYDVKKTVNFR